MAAWFPNLSHYPVIGALKSKAAVGLQLPGRVSTHSARVRSSQTSEVWSWSPCKRSLSHWAPHLPILRSRRRWLWAGKNHTLLSLDFSCGHCGMGELGCVCTCAHVRMCVQGGREESTVAAIWGYPVAAWLTTPLSTFSSSLSLYASLTLLPPRYLICYLFYLQITRPSQNWGVRATPLSVISCPWKMGCVKRPRRA